MVPPMPKRLLKVEQSNLSKTTFELHKRGATAQSNTDTLSSKNYNIKIACPSNHTQNCPKPTIRLGEEEVPNIEWNIIKPLLSHRVDLSSPLTISADIAEDGDLFQMSVTLEGKLVSFNILLNDAKRNPLLVASILLRGLPQTKHD